MRRFLRATLPFEAGAHHRAVLAWRSRRFECPIVERLRNEIGAVLGEAEIRERYATLGIEPVGNTPEQFTDQIRADLARWAPVVRQAGIRIE